jgi:hypothetical protein
MRSVIAAAAFLIAGAGPAHAQPAAKIQIALEARSEGRETREGAGAQLYDDVRRGLQAIGDVEIVPAAQARRVVWIVAGAAAGPFAASMMITERYDRETLMVLGIEDDDMAARMMALQIVNDHQIFTAADRADLARRIVAAIDTGVLARLRAVRSKG